MGRQTKVRRRREWRRSRRSQPSEARARAVIARSVDWPDFDPRQLVTQHTPTHWVFVLPDHVDNPPPIEPEPENALGWFKSAERFSEHAHIAKAWDPATRTATTPCYSFALVREPDWQADPHFSTFLLPCARCLRWAMRRGLV